MKANKLWKLWRLRALFWLAAIGPGFITANVDNDPNGIYTYSVAGARFGYSLLWTTLPVLLALMVVQGNYKQVEKVFLVASFFYVAYIVAGALSQPQWATAGVRTVEPPPMHEFRDSSYLYLVVAIVGATIAPWMQFYLQASVVEK